MQTLPIIDELEAALASGTNARRIEMLTRITDLFVGGAPRFTEAQTGVFDDIMVRLVSAIEAKARAKLAHRLAPIANAPLNTIHMLAFDDDIEVAATVLSQSERLDENALLANAGSKSQQRLFAIAQRKSLSEAVTDMLVERGDREVVHSVVKNSGAHFSDAGFRMLVKRRARCVPALSRKTRKPAPLAPASWPRWLAASAARRARSRPTSPPHRPRWKGGTASGGSARPRSINMRASANS